MNTQLQSKEQEKPVQLPVDTNNEVFNFEVWAKAVRPLFDTNNDEVFNFEVWAKAVKPRLIAALQKRNTKLHKS